uniref:Uncharacterized protein n=1 Tax=Anopheles minimus TaxID=112268 RepID=A0A182W157_9DIPT
MYNSNNTNHHHNQPNGVGNGAGSNHSKGRSKPSSHTKRNDYERPGGPATNGTANPTANTTTTAASHHGAGSAAGAVELVGKSAKSGRKLSCELFESPNYGDPKHTGKHTKSKSQSQMLLLPTPTTNNTATLPAHMLSTAPSVHPPFHRSSTASAMSDSRETSPESPSPPPLPPLPLGGHLPIGATNGGTGNGGGGE